MAALIIGITSSLAATALVALATLAYARTRATLKAYRKYARTVDRMKLSGVTEVFFSRAQYGTASDPAATNILRYLSTAQIRVRYIGLWMAQASEQYRLDEVIRQLLERGCEVKFCILDPRMSASKLSSVSETLGLNPSEVRQRIKIAAEKLQLLKASLPANLIPRLEVRVHDIPLVASLIEFDWDTAHHKCWLDFKLRGRGRAESITLEVTPAADPLIQRVSMSFEEVQQKSKPFT